MLDLNKVTNEQMLSLERIWARHETRPSFPAFLRSAQSGHDCIMVPYCEMWLGIESDGYTHS